MKKSLPTIMVIVLLLSIYCSSCESGLSFGTSASPTPAVTSTSPMTSTPAPTSTPSPTPTPISVKSAIDKGSFSEIESIGKGEIQHNIFSPDGSIFIAVVMRGIYIYDTNSWNEIKFISTTPGESVTATAFSEDGSIFAAGDSTGDVTFWDTAAWELKKTINVYKGPIINLDLSPDKLNFAVIAGQDGKYQLSLWDLNETTLIASQQRTEMPGRVDYAMDGTWIMLSDGRDATIWTSADLKLINRISELGGYAISPYSDTIASVSFFDVYIYDFKTQKTTRVEKLLNPFDDVSNIIFANESSLVVKKEGADSCYLIDLESGRWSETSFDSLTSMKYRNPEIGLITKSDEIQSLGFVPYAEILDISRNGNFLILEKGIFDLNSKTMLEKSMQSEYLWTNYEILNNGDVSIINPGKNQAKKGTFAIFTFSGDDFSRLSTKMVNFDLEEAVEEVALSPDRSLLAAGLFDGSLCLWNVDSNELIVCKKWAHKTRTEFGRVFAYRDIEFDNQGSQIITSGVDGTRRNWNVADLSEISSSREFGTFSPDGRYFASTSSTNIVTVKSVEGEAAPIQFNENSSRVLALLFSADNELLLSGGWDGIKIWSLAEQSLLMDLPQSDAVASLVFSPDGTQLYVYTIDGVISIWGDSKQ